MSLTDWFQSLGIAVTALGTLATAYVVIFKLRSDVRVSQTAATANDAGAAKAVTEAWRPFVDELQGQVAELKTSLQAERDGRKADRELFAQSQLAMRLELDELRRKLDDAEQQLALARADLSTERTLRARDNEQHARTIDSLQAQISALQTRGATPAEESA
jgi:hypothetical protein